jgi:hypothetical protein
VIQLHILSGKLADTDIVVRQFPFRIGRSAGSLPLDDDGVWDSHLEIGFDREAGFTFTSPDQASVFVNGEPAASGRLANGDLIQLGVVQIRFWLARATQHSLRLRETLTWAALIALFAVQVGLFYWLLR